MGTHVWEFRLSIQVCVWVLTFSIHIQLVRFRYSDSGIQVWNSDLGIQVWVYRLADKYKVLTFSGQSQIYKFPLKKCLWFQNIVLDSSQLPAMSMMTTTFLATAVCTIYELYFK